MTRRVDFTKPDTIKKIASFPFYGQAEALIRQIDPLWKLDMSVPHDWVVRAERETHFCTCEYCDRSDMERTSVTVEAMTSDDAEELALAELERTHRGDWDVVSVTLAGKSPVEFPDWIYETEGVA